MANEENVKKIIDEINRDIRKGISELAKSYFTEKKYGKEQIMKTAQELAGGFFYKYTKAYPPEDVQEAIERVILSGPAKEDSGFKH